MKYYQPVFDQRLWYKKSFYSFMVYRSRETAQGDFPTLKIEEYEGGDIEDPMFIDDHSLASPR